MHIRTGLAAATPGPFASGAVTPLLRIAAIDFLNPAPLMWNFEHPPEAARLELRYDIERMTPARCAASLLEGTADLGLIPVGAYSTIPDLAIIPGCTIASLGAIRSLLLVVRAAEDSPPRSLHAAADAADLEPPSVGELQGIRAVALDTASRTTALYTQILFRRYWEHAPGFLAHPPAIDPMLAFADAAVLIGDPALHALRDREARAQRTGERLRYLDLGHLWREATGTAWVSAFWAVRRAALRGMTNEEQQQIVTDLLHSRDAGLMHIPDLAREWAPSLGLTRSTIQTYLAENIHYILDDEVEAGIRRFLAEAHALGLIPAPPPLRFLAPPNHREI